MKLSCTGCGGPLNLLKAHCEYCRLPIAEPAGDASRYDFGWTDYRTLWSDVLETHSVMRVGTCHNDVNVVRYVGGRKS